MLCAFSPVRRSSVKDQNICKGLTNKLYNDSIKLKGFIKNKISHKIKALYKHELKIYFELIIH
jgi:hypothetical protein